MRLLMPFAVTGEAAGAGLLPGVISEDEYLSLVATTLHVLGSGTMAGFATLLRRSGFLIKCGLPVGRFLPTVVNLLVARLAGFSADVLRDFRRSRTGRECAGRFGALMGSLWGSLAWNKFDYDEKEQE